MPVAAGPPAYHSQLPSFMSVYTCNAPDMDNTFAESPQKSEIAPSGRSQRGGDSAVTSPDAQHKHRDSTSTQASESTDSSPTSTISTADSSALTDPSPSSSPESPVVILPLSSFSSTGFGIHSLDDLTMSDNPIIGDSFERPMTSPLPRKPRNAKGLALKLGSLEPLVQASAPASPAAFVRPPLPKPRKKPSNLSLQTTSNFGAIPTRSLSMEPPPTPSGRRVTMLHHAASTSDMSVFSPDPRGLAGPQGGMRLPGFERSQISGLSNAFRRPTPILESRSPGSQGRIEEISPIRTQLATRSGADIGGDTFDCAANEDAKSPGYPDGPIAIYEPYVFLYLEPTAEEAAGFDVVINVASEVKNPFKARPAPEKHESSVPVPPNAFDAMEIDRENISEPMTAASIATFSTALETQPTDSSATPTETSPTTPKPIAKEPEYIHVLWEHNTDISNDLMGLCETIDNRVNKGKRVLVHCQQGASRSASLIIAYGMYRNPSLTVDAAYNAAQDKSKYVSPNINLMYALQDFRKTLQARIPKIGGRSPAKHRMALSVDEIDFSVKETPRTAPLPLDPNTRISPVGTPPHARGNSTPNLRELSPGPSSAPTFPWPSGDPKSMLHSDSDSASKPQLPKLDFGEKEMLKMAPPSDSEVKLRSTTVDFPPTISKPPTFPGSQSSFTQASIDTPPNSQPASPPALRGFAAHRDERTAKRKPAPSLNFKPVQPLRPAPSLPILQSNISIRPTYPPPTIPSPSLWSPRLSEIPSQSSALWSPRLPPSSFAHHHQFTAPTPTPAPLPQLSIAATSTSSDTPPTPTIMSPCVGDFGINPFAEIFAADPATERLQQAPGFRKKKSFVFQKPDLALAMEKPLPDVSVGARMGGVEQGKEKPLPPLPVDSGTLVVAERGVGAGSGTKTGPGEEGKKASSAIRVVDPRSPGVFGAGVGVVRSIDDML